MPRRALARCLTAAATTVVLGAGLVPAVYATTPVPAVSASEPETVVPAGSRWQPAQEKLLTAGAGGYLATSDAGSTRWVDEATGAEGASQWAPGTANIGLKANQNGSTVTVTDLATATAVAAVLLPAGQRFTGAFRSDALVTNGTDAALLHILHTAPDGTTTDQPVTGVPAGAVFHGLVAQSADFAVYHLNVDGATHTYLLSYAGASVREIFASLPATAQVKTIVGGTRVLTYDGSRAYSVRFDDPAATVETTPYPAAVLHDTEAAVPVPVGDQVLFVRSGPTVLGGPTGPGGQLGLPLSGVPVGGGAAQTLLTDSGSSYAIAPDGSVLVVGGTGPDDWAVRRVTAAPGAAPVLTAVRPLAPVPARIFGLAYSAGQLLYSTNTTLSSALLSRAVGTGATSAVGAPAQPWKFNPATVRTCATNVFCVPLQGLGTGSVASTVPGTDMVEAPVPGDPNAIYDAQTGANDNVVSDASDGHTLITSPSQGKQWVADLGLGYTAHPEVTRTTSAAALWGHIFWVPGAAGKGGVRPYNLSNRTFGTTFQTAAACTAFAELQADDRWLYWSCGTTAGVFDWKTRRNIPVPAGTDTLLGDGYLVRHDKARGKLVLTDFHTGTAVTRDLADLPAGAVADDRGVTWSVDKYGGGVAYTDAAQRIHVLPLAGIVPQNLSLLRSDVYGGSLGTYPVPLTGQWDYSRPTSGWTLAIKNAVGKVVATRTGTSRNGTNVNASWDLTTSPGHYAGAGTYTWTITAQPRDGRGPWLSTSGTWALRRL